MVILVYAPDDSTTSSVGSYSVTKFALFSTFQLHFDFPLGYCLRSFGGSSRFPSKSDQMVSDACCALGAVVRGQRLHHETCQSIWRFGVGCPSLKLSSNTCMHTFANWYNVDCVMYMHGCWLFILFGKDCSTGPRLYLRNVLLRAGVFGNDANVGIGVKLARAYEKFKSWQSSKRIHCSQPKFTEKMVPGTCFCGHFLFERLPGSQVFQCQFLLWFNTCTVMSTKIFKKNSDILFTLKAFNGRVVLEWLCDEIIQFCQIDGCDNFDPRVFHIATAANLLRNYRSIDVLFFIPGSGSSKYII